ncbi:MAG TPA: carbohydrate-binding domain-containing protein [Chloroflexaceae bacterium]|nr:carbohydrate-binding domain-containing protein [Chloroflexaceae bacterium]
MEVEARIGQPPLWLSRVGRPLLWYLLASAIIVGGLWMTPVELVPPHTHDEPQWLSHSLCGDAVATGTYAHTCLELSHQSVDHSAGTKYLLTAMRMLNGIPAAAVQRLYDTSASTLDPDIRAAGVRFMTALASITLLLLFAGVRRLYGTGAALVTLALIVLTPGWLFTMRAIMAEGPLFLFIVATWLSTLWLIKLVTTPGTPTWHLVAGAVCLGLSLGLAVGVKPNAALLVAGIVATLVALGWQTTRHWFTLLWLGAVVALCTFVCFVLTNPLLWSPDFPVRLQAAVNFRSGILSLQRLVFADKNLPDPSASVYAGLSGLLTSPEHTILPIWLGLPMVALGIWSGLSLQRPLSRMSHIWLLAVCAANLPIVPLDAARYFLFARLAFTIFAGVGIAQLVQIAARRALPAPASPEPLQIQPRRYGRPALAVAWATVAATALATAVSGLAIARAGQTRQLWQEYVVAEYHKDLPAQLRALRAAMSEDPGGYTYMAEPTIDLAQKLFMQQSATSDPMLLGEVKALGQLLVAHSPSSDLRAQVAYDLEQLDRRLTGVRAISIGPIQPKHANAIIPSAPGQFALYTNGDYVQVPVQLPTDGSYNILVNAQHRRPAPVLLAVAVDDVVVGTLSYGRGDDSWEEQALPITLSAGSHVVRVSFTNDASGPDGDRNAIVKGISIVPPVKNDLTLSLCWAEAPPAALAGPRCATEGPLRLDAARPSASLSVTAQLPGLYDIGLAVNPSADKAARVTVGGRPIGSTGGRGRLQAIHLRPGPHTIEIALEEPGAGPLEVAQIELRPRYPSIATLTPERFGSASPDLLSLRPGDTAQSSWRWYGMGYSYFSLHLFGSAAQGRATVELSINGHPIGTVPLDDQGTPPPPLPVELSRGGQHSVTLRPLGLTAGQQVYIYAVAMAEQPVPIPIAASNMRWGPEHNAVVQAIGESVLLGPGASISRTLPIELAGDYTVTVRTRSVSAADGEPAQISVRVGAIELGPLTLQPAPGWENHRLKVFLPAGKQTFTIERIDGGHQRAEVIHLVLEQEP